MSNDDNDNIDPMLMGEQPSRARSTPAKPVVDETWTQVEELPEDHDSDFTDEEVEYIALDFGADFPKEQLKQAESIQLTNLNTSEPWIRVGSQIMRGRHERMLGSDLLFDMPPADPDTGKVDNVSPVGTTQARIRFEPVTLQARSTGNPAVPKQNASSYLAPKAGSAAAASRGGRGRGRGGRGRRRSNTATKGREGSAASSSAVGDHVASGIGDRDASMELVDQEGQTEASPTVEEF